MAQKLPHRTFGKTKLSVSVLGFGAAPVAYTNADEQRAVTIVQTLLDGGCNFIDTAASYPGSEEFLGKHFSERRKEFVLVSKVGGKISESDAPAWSTAQVAASIDRSLKRLKTDHVDVMLLHTCSLDVLKQGEAFGALVKARDAGKIRFAGYSGDNEAAAYAAGLKDLAVIETSINLTDQINLDMVMPLAVKNDIGIIAKRPVANGAWKEIAQQQGMYQSYAKTYTDRLAKMNITPESVGFDGDWPELALRFTLSHPGVATAIIGTTNLDNTRANLTYASRGELPALVVQTIRDAFRKSDPNGQWTGQT